MALNPYRPVRGSAVVPKIVINAPAADFARVYIKRTDGTMIMNETDMVLHAPGVYKYVYQIPNNMPLTTYNVFVKVGLNGRTVKDKQSFIVVAD